ncbi:MAG: hypothetical protein ACFFDT_07040 [Candidatus Hodarchaeota archaeon]
MAKLMMIGAGILIVLGVCASGIGIIVPGYVNNEITSQVEDALILKDNPDKDDDSFDEFFAEPDLDEDTPTYISYHFYNITNGAEVMAGSADPIFAEIEGKYTVRKVKEKIQYTGADVPIDYQSDKFVTYGGSTYYIEENSTLSGDEWIVQFNPVYYGVLANPLIGGNEMNLVASVASDALNQTFYGLAAGIATAQSITLTQAIPLAEGHWGNLSLIPAMNATGYEAAAYVLTKYSIYLGLSTEQVDNILFNPLYPVTNATGLGAWLTFVDLNDYNTLNALYAPDTNSNMTVQQIDLLTEYFLYVGQSTIYDTLRAGFIAKRTIHEWLFDFSDPFALINAGFVSNDTSYLDEKIVINTGTDDINNIWQEVIHWDKDIVDFTNDGGKTLNTSLWKVAEEIGGTDATRFAPDVEDDNVLQIFNTDTWRKLNLTYVKDVQHKDIDMLRFHLQYEHFLPDLNYYQTIPGYANMSQARSGVPIFLSLPRVFNNSLDNPDYDLNGEELDIVIDVEPITGLVMNAHKRLQMNLGISTDMLYYLAGMNTTAGALLGLHSGFNVTYADDSSANVPFAPIFWGDEHGQISDDDVADFKNKVYDIQEFGEMIGLIGLIGGPTLIFTGAIMAVVNYTKVPKPE